VSGSDVFLAELVEEIARRLQSGEEVEVETYAAAHPKLADQLRRLWPTVLALAGLGGSVARGEVAAATGPAELGVLGDFRLVREIGRGGMGIVYEAEQISLSRRVALKVLSFAAALDNRYLQRFKHEAQIAGHLNHSNIVPVFMVGCERNVHYYAMQLIEGRTLGALIRELRQSSVPSPVDTRIQPALVEGPSPAAVQTIREVARSTEHSPLDPLLFRTRVRLILQAAEALEYAHEQGIVHRDIKPGNLLIDARGKLWVSDFGLAQLQTDLALTVTGDLVGTLRYMSPEQTLGRRVALDPRTDIYSLGATLYELLTLEPVFTGTDRQELLNQITQEEPRPLRQLNKMIPVELETIVLKAMAKEVDQRYATAREFADDLCRFLENKPIRARRPTLTDRLTKWCRRHRSLVVAAAVFLILAVLGLTAGMVRIEYERDRTARERDEVLKRESLLRQMLYCQDMNMAQRAWESGRLAWMRELLDRHRPAGNGEADLRGFEWDYLDGLWRHAPREVASVAGHASEAYFVTYSPDGRMLASSGKDGYVRFWDAQTLRPVREALSHQDEVNEIAFTSDGRWLASSSDDGLVCLWDLHEPTPRPEQLIKSTTWITSLAVSPDGKKLAASGRAGIIWQWDVATRNLLGEVDLQAGAVGSLAYSPDSRTLAAATNRSGAVLLDATPLRMRTACDQAEAAESVCLSRDGNTLAVGHSYGGEITLWDVSSARRRLTLKGHQSNVESIAFSEDNSLLVSGGNDGTICFWDFPSGTLRSVTDGYGVGVWSVAFSRGFGRLATANGDGTIRLWNVPARPNHRTLPLDMVGVAGVAFHPDNRSLTSYTLGGSLQEIDTVSGRSCEEPWTHEGGVCAVALTPDGQACVMGSASGQLIFQDRISPTLNGAGGPRHRREVRRARGIQALAISPDGTRAAFVGKDDPTVWTWDLASDQKKELTVLAAPCACLAYSPDGTVLAAWGGPEVRLLGATDGQRQTSLLRHSGNVSSIAFSPDGTTVATGGADKTVKLWEASTGKEFANLFRHRALISAVTFTPDGRTLASGDVGGKVVLWHVARGAELISLETAAPIYSLAFSPDGTLLACGGGMPRQKGIITLWNGSRE
jgi:WD40 repeat protein/serine/threonine protein kinase